LIQIIDGNIIVALHNDTNEDKIVKGGDRIAQLVVIPYMSINLTLTDSLDETDRGQKGFRKYRSLI